MMTRRFLHRKPNKLLGIVSLAFGVSFIGDLIRNGFDLFWLGVTLTLLAMACSELMPQSLERARPFVRRLDLTLLIICMYILVIRELWKLF
jgi:hypothetical protein